MTSTYKTLGNRQGGDPKVLCECGCGSPAPIAKRTVAKKGWIKGQPRRFVSGHNARVRAPIFTHGHARRGVYSPTYISWSAMLARCNNPKCPEYERYGGRGVAVCARWRDFANFLADMGKRPPGRTLDREDNDGNYEPSNCRWATPKEQARHFIKTHCKNGHLLAGDNLEYEGSQRKCRTCKAAAKRRYKARQRTPEGVAA